MYRLGNTFSVSSPFPFRHSTHEPNCIVIGGRAEQGNTVRVESSQKWTEQTREEMRTKYNVQGDDHLPFTIEAGDTPVVIPMLNSDESYLETFLRFIVSTTTMN